MTTTEYIERIATRYKTGISREHSYRGDLQTLLESICSDVLVTNEPARVACGAPDYILTRKDIPVGYMEAKDVGADLGSKNHKEQFDRYRKSLPNLIITDYLDFWLYRDGEFVTSIAIGQIDGGSIKGMPGEYAEFEDLIKDFSMQVSQSIRSSKKLAGMMAGKARLLANVIENALNSDEETENYKLDSANNTLREQLDAFRTILIHDIKPKEFADIYAQTIAYGMFAARLHDPTLNDFSRQEAAELIPKSNPFLRKLFQYIAGYDLDDRLVWIVDALADIFRATDVAALLKDFGKATQQNDPIIHFYETFLGEYDPKLRKARGVWYTPEPVVNFIVRAVDDILKSEFGLKDGLADTSKVKVKANTDVRDARSKTGYKQVEQEVHRVQILDPATGTGTFLAEVVKHIHKKFEGQQGIWSQYVENELLPRLNGFEILMASYAMAHLKLDMLLAETGYKPKKEQRFRVYLTNSLEEHHPDTGTLFANWLSSEANEADRIKRDTPVMVVMGNPPYSGESQNKGKWIMDLMDDYKKEPGGKEKLKERNPKWINDDYVKFMRYSQHFIEKNGEGILAFINPHGFLDNPTFRGMRWNLLKTYDKIYVIDLHGNAKKKEVAPDGSKDENVFDIMQGVSINILVKNKSDKVVDTIVNHFDSFGARSSKYEFLAKQRLESVDFQKINPIEPYYYFFHEDSGLKKEYNRGIQIKDLFNQNGNGMVSKRDPIAYHDSESGIMKVIQDIKSLSEDEITNKYTQVSWKSRDGKVEFVKNNVMEHGLKEQYFIKCNYRPFDIKWTYYTGKSKGFIGWPVMQIMSHFIEKENFSLNLIRRSRSNDFIKPFITHLAVDKGILSTLDNSNIFPLYLYPENTDGLEFESTNRTPNLNMELVGKIAEGLGLTFVPEKLDKNGNVCFAQDPDLRPEFRTEFAPIDLLDYIYAVLHSPGYREKYKEFLKIDFPRVPYPTDKTKFWQLVALGGQLRGLHLLESEEVEQFITTYPQDGSNVVERKMTKSSIGYEATSETKGRVWINDVQYFDKVPLEAWEFYIGGYQPAQKWLKDRNSRTLSFDDIRHYQKIIAALSGTAKLIREVDALKVER